MLLHVRRSPLRPFLSPLQLSRRSLIAQPPHRIVTPRPLPTNVRPTSDEALANKTYMQEQIKDVQDLRTKAREGGGAQVLEKWKSRGKGKMGARERYVWSGFSWMTSAWVSMA